MNDTPSGAETATSVTAPGSDPADRIIDGKAFAGKLREQVAEWVADLQSEYGVTPGLAMILVGDDSASEVYVRGKARKSREAGMRSVTYHLPYTTETDDLLALIGRLNADPGIDGILVQLPLPAHIDHHQILEAVDPTKDVDGFHPINVGRLSTGNPGLVPCTPLGCLLLLRDRLGDLSGLMATVIGRSNIVGKPMGQLLLRENCTVISAHSHTRDLSKQCRDSDILVSAVGRPGLVQADWIKPGATVLDVGIRRQEDETGKVRLVGDVDFAGVIEVARHVTPVPGGVGPMTIACLLRNTVSAAHRRRGLPDPAASF